MTRLACDMAALAKAEPSRSGSGILNFLKTELDSFVKGLSGKADDVSAQPIAGKICVCLTPAVFSQEDVVHPPKKRTKRSHHRNAANDTRSDAWELAADLQHIDQHTTARLQHQGQLILTCIVVGRS